VPVETEIKLRLVEGVESARRLLEQHGFLETSPRQLEVDQVYDLPNQELRLSGRLLRLRHSGTLWTLTFKGPPSPGRHKSREEIETTLADCTAFEAILAGLGYERSFRYEKYRTKFGSRASGEGIVTLDETPLGVFLELEGPSYWIDQTAARLGFSGEEFITRSYSTLYQEYLRAHPEAPRNMTFLGSSEPAQHT
jgi:adenylate cyclase class 2